MTLDSDRYRQALAAIQNYESKHRHPGRPSLIIHEPHTLGEEGSKGSWEGTQASYRQGCYILFSADGDVLYVGKASYTKSLGSRLVRFRYSRVDWSPRPQTVVMVEVPNAFEARSLEEFLISDLQPRFNDHGRSRA